jgi:hypothetical protein
VLRDSLPDKNPATRRTRYPAVWADVNLDSLPQGIEQPKQPIQREPVDSPPHQVRHLRLVETEQLARLGLSHTPRIDQPPNPQHDLGLGQSEVRTRKGEVLEHVSGARPDTRGGNVRCPLRSAGVRGSTGHDALSRRPNGGGWCRYRREECEFPICSSSGTHGGHTPHRGTSRCRRHDRRCRLGIRPVKFDLAELHATIDIGGP